MCNMLNLTGVDEFLQPSIYGLISYPKDLSRLYGVLLGKSVGSIWKNCFWIKLCLSVREVEKGWEGAFFCETRCFCEFFCINLEYSKKSSTFGRRLRCERIPPKVRSQNAEHTTVRSKFYKKIGYALIIRYPSSHFQAGLNE